MNNTSLLGGRPDLIQVREQAHEHLLARIEELGAEFGRWTRQAIQDFVGIELASFVRLKRVFATYTIPSTTPLRRKSWLKNSKNLRPIISTSLQNF